MSNGGGGGGGGGAYQKALICPLSLVLGVLNKKEHNLLEIVACKSFASVKFDLLPLLQGHVGSAY